MAMAKSFRLLTLAGFGALALIGLAPSQAQAEAARVSWLAAPLIQNHFGAAEWRDAALATPERASQSASQNMLAPAQASGLTAAFAALTAPDFNSKPQTAASFEVALNPSAAATETGQFLAALRADEAAPSVFVAASLAPTAPLAPAEAPALPPATPVAVIVLLEAVRPERALLLADLPEDPAPLLEQAPLEAVRHEQQAQIDPAQSDSEVLTMAELEGHAGGTGVNIGLLTNQILTGVSAGNSINAGQVSSGGITIETDAFSGYDGIGNFVINSGHNNVLQSSVNVSIVMTPP